MCEDKVERCVICHNPIGKDEPVQPRLDGTGVAHEPCIRDSTPKEYRPKIA